MKCGYEGCDQEIINDRKSPSGYSHVHTADWQHWASSIKYKPGSEETDRIFEFAQRYGLTDCPEVSNVRF